MRDTSLDEFIGGDEADADEGEQADFEDERREGEDEKADVEEDLEDEQADVESERGGDEDERANVEAERTDSEEGAGPDEDERAGVEDENGDDESADDAGRVPGDDGGDEDCGAVQPAVSTSDWTPDGGSCAGCGEEVERRWRDGGDLVCADCKRW